MSSVTFDFELITPQGIILQEKIQDLVANTEAGEIGILVNHIDLKTKLVPTAIKYKGLSGKLETAAVLGGILEVEKNKVTIISDYAELGKDINEAQAKNAAEDARAKVQLLEPDAKRSDRELILAEAQLQKEMLRLRAVQLRKN
jgi:F-type H+-transporting ATPase subunit epsilon